MSVVALAVVASQTFNMRCVMSEYGAKHQYVGPSDVQDVIATRSPLWEIEFITIVNTDITHHQAWDLDMNAPVSPTIYVSGLVYKNRVDGDF